MQRVCTGSERVPFVRHFEGLYRPFSKYDPIRRSDNASATEAGTVAVQLGSLAKPDPNQVCIRIHLQMKHWLPPMSTFASRLASILVLAFTLFKRCVHWRLTMKIFYILLACFLFVPSLILCLDDTAKSDKSASVALTKKLGEENNIVLSLVKSVVDFASNGFKSKYIQSVRFVTIFAHIWSFDSGFRGIDAIDIQQTSDYCRICFVYACRCSGHASLLRVSK